MLHYKFHSLSVRVIFSSVHLSYYTKAAPTDVHRFRKLSSHRAINMRNMCKAHIVLSAESRGETGAQTGSSKTPPGLSVPSAGTSQITGATEKIIKLCTIL